MKQLHKKSRFHQFLDKVDDALDVPSGVKSGLSGLGSSNPLTSVPRSQGLKAGAVAGAIAGLTAASAAISSLRRRGEGARDNS